MKTIRGWRRRALFVQPPAISQEADGKRVRSTIAHATAIPPVRRETVAASCRCSGFSCRSRADRPGPGRSQPGCVHQPPGSPRRNASYRMQWHDFASAMRCVRSGVREREAVVDAQNSSVRSRKVGPGSMPLEGNVYAHRIDKVRRLLLRLSSQEQFRRIGQAPGRLAFVSVLAIHNLKNSYGTGLAMNEDRTATQSVFAPAYRAFFWRAAFFACALVYLMTSAEFEAARAVYEAY